MTHNQALEMKLDTKYWLKFSIFNLLLVAGLGALMRYKIGFEFPYFDQKYIQEAHSHFAFIGWITHTIYVLMINFIQSKVANGHFKNYRILLVANLVCAYGIIISFATWGYGLISITLLTFIIVIACLFAWNAIKDLNKIENKHPTVAWFKSALWFNIISSIGTFYLGYMMATRDFDEHLYLAAVYFYLHFQYNGFFIFSCMGLVYSQIDKIFPSFKMDNSIFILFFASAIPAYFLSTLWANLPWWLYAIVIIAALVQVIAWVKFLGKIRNSQNSQTNLTNFMKYLFLFVAIAFSIKLVLQLGSTIPMVSKLAFGFRPIVIAYLHLVLLAVVTVFLLAFVHSFNFIKENKLSITGIALFSIGIFLNELVLAIQGIASFSYIAVPMANEMLFIIALILFASLALLVISQTKKETKDVL